MRRWARMAAAAGAIWLVPGPAPAQDTTRMDLMIDQTDTRRRAQDYARQLREPGPAATTARERGTAAAPGATATEGTAGPRTVSPDKKKKKLVQPGGAPKSTAQREPTLRVIPTN